MFLNKIRNIFVSRTEHLCPQQMLRAQANICVGNNVSATMCTRLSGPLIFLRNSDTLNIPDINCSVTARKFYLRAKVAPEDLF